MFDKVWTLPRAIEMLVENPSFPDTKNKQKKPKIFRPCPSNRTKHALDKTENYAKFKLHLKVQNYDHQ